MSFTPKKKVSRYLEFIFVAANQFWSVFFGRAVQFSSRWKNIAKEKKTRIDTQDNNEMNTNFGYDFVLPTWEMTLKLNVKSQFQNKPGGVIHSSGLQRLQKKKMQRLNKVTKDHKMSVHQISRVIND